MSYSKPRRDTGLIEGNGKADNADIYHEETKKMINFRPRKKETP